MATELPPTDQGVPNDDHGPAILGATLTVTIAALMTMVTRLYVRIRMIRNMGWDDYVMMSAMILCVIGQIIVIPEVHYGAGRHIQYIDPADFAEGLKFNFITQPIYLFAICLVKVSVGFFLLRIAVACVYRRIIIGTMAFVVFYTVGGFFTIVLQCPNLAVQWDHTVKGTCWGPRIMKPLSYTNVSLNITTDILFSIVIPIPLLWSLQMNKRQRTSLICIFGLGIFATVAALVRLSFLTIYGKTGDWLWDSRDLTIWTIVESNIGIIAGNLPCLKPLFRAVLGNTHGTNSRTTPAPTYGYSTRPYGGGTGLQSANGKGWGALTSSRTADADADADVDATPELARNLPRSFGVAKDSYLLTTINAEQRESKVQRASARPDERGSAGAGSSVESLTRTVACSGLGGIKVDTEVNVVESPSPLYAEFGDAERKVRESLV